MIDRSNSTWEGPAKRLVDGHCHVASSQFIPKSFIAGVVENVSVAVASRGVEPDRTRLMDIYLDKLQDDECVELLRQMDEAGIERAVLLVPDFTYALKDSCLSIAEMYERHHELMTLHADRFYVFAGVDPRWGRDAVDLFERGVREYGFHGLKLYPPCGYQPSDQSLYPFYEICAAHGLPVLTHVGPTSPVFGFETALPILIDTAARKFPAVNFILAHGSVSHTDDCVRLCAYRPNVYLDISAFQTRPCSELRPLFERGINHKIIFGTDWPLFRVQGRQKAFIQRLRSEEGPLDLMNDGDRANFWGGTIERLIGVSPTARLSSRSQVQTASANSTE